MANKAVEVTEVKAEKIEAEVVGAITTVVDKHEEAATVHMEVAEEHLAAAKVDREDLSKKHLISIKN